METDAKKFFLQAQYLANQGNVDGIAALGMCYREGIGIEKDEAKAFDFLKRAADLGHVGSMVPLADFYEKGVGTMKCTPFIGHFK